MAKIEIVREWMRLKYRVDLNDLEISDVPGLTEKEPREGRRYEQ